MEGSAAVARFQGTRRHSALALSCSPTSTTTCQNLVASLPHTFFDMTDVLDHELTAHAQRAKDKVVLITGGTCRAAVVAASCSYRR